MLARTLAVVGVVGGAVWAMSKYLKAQNGTNAVVGASGNDTSAATPNAQNGNTNTASRSVNATAPNGSRNQTGPNH